MLAVPEGLTVRPMRARIRESLFSLLGDEVASSRFLDGFAGSGAIGIEALSRGAREVVLVENNPTVIACLNRNLSDLGLERRMLVLEVDLYDTQGLGKGFDIIFLDPPFAHFERSTLDPWSLAFRLAEGNALEENGLIGVEAPASQEPPTAPTLALERRRRYGDTQLVMWRKSRDPGS